MSLNFISPGLLTTIQDLGRKGYQKDGMVVSGAMDTLALRVANLLVGNAEGEAGLEITLIGPRIFFPDAQLVALTGADLSPLLNGIPVKGWRPIFVEEGSVLEFGAPVSGCRTYLAVAGGLDVPEVLGSKSTYLRAGIGGYQGRALQTGDSIPCHGIPARMRDFLQLTKEQHAKPGAQPNWFVDTSMHVAHHDPQEIRVIKGPEYLLFSELSQQDFFAKPYKVSARSDRMGYQLRGTRLWLDTAEEAISSAVTFGTVQVPPAGDPILLMADHQTTGGYPRVAQVISADFSKLAQLVPRHKIQFTEVTLEEAQSLYLRQEKNLEKLRGALSFKTTI